LSLVYGFSFTPNIKRTHAALSVKGYISSCIFLSIRSSHSYPCLQGHSRSPMLQPMESKAHIGLIMESYKLASCLAQLSQDWSIFAGYACLPDLFGGIRKPTPQNLHEDPSNSIVSYGANPISTSWTILVTTCAKIIRKWSR